MPVTKALPKEVWDTIRTNGGPVTSIANSLFLDMFQHCKDICIGVWVEHDRLTHNNLSFLGVGGWVTGLLDSKVRCCWKCQKCNLAILCITNKGRGEDERDIIDIRLESIEGYTYAYHATGAIG